MSHLLSQQTVLEPIVTLTLHPQNPRQGDIGAIGTSINRLGFYGGIVCQRSTRHILVGNHRWQAAMNEGLTHVPVFWVDVDDEHALRILLADNRTSELASYDDNTLIELLKDLADTPLGFEGTGWDGDALDELMNIYAESQPAPEPEVQHLPPVEQADPDDAPAPVQKEAITKPGDVWILGSHRLVCGDATSVTDLEKLMQGELADMLFTDPPYGVSAKGGRDTTLASHGLRRIANDDLRGEDLYAFLLDAFATMPLREGASFYVCYDHKTQIEFGTAIRDASWTRKFTIVWNKNVFGLGNKGYRPKFELIAFGHAGGSDYDWHGGNDQADVWDIPRPNRNDIGGEHPTPKPVALIERALNNSSVPGAIVLDCFGGSGSTLIAAQSTGRNARLMEIDPVYCDLIVARWEKFTGAKAVLGK
jgi:DNA modification methylase